MAKKLEQTKSSFKLIGKVSRIDKDGAYEEAEQTKDGKHKGDTYRKLKFGVKTSKTNEITVEMYDYEPERVFLWNSEKKKEDKEYKGDWIPFGTWEEQEEDLKAQGYAVLQSRIGLEKDDKGKIISRGVPSYVASEEIYNNVDNNDSVVVEGEIRYSEFENQQGELMKRKSFTIKKLYKLTKDVDFDAEDFEEITYYEQEMVYVDIDIDKKEGKAFVIGRIIDFAGNFVDSQFIIPLKDEEGNEDEKMTRLAKTIKDKISFGDVIKVYGDTLNRAVIKQVEKEDDKDDLFAQFGGKKKPKHAESYTARDYISEMQIHGLEEWTEAVYEEEDFVKEELIENSGKKSLSDEFGGKSKKKGKNPFETDEDDDEGYDGELPF